MNHKPSTPSLGWGLFWPGEEGFCAVSLLRTRPDTKTSVVAVNYGRTAVRYVVDDADIMPLPRNAAFASLSPWMGNA